MNPYEDLMSMTEFSLATPQALTVTPKTLLSKYIKPKKVVTYSADGIPIHGTEWIIPKDSIPQLIQELASIPLNELQEAAQSGEIEQYSGLEVAIIRQVLRASQGGADALNSLNFILDRTVGKPKQYIESVNVNMSIEQFLSQLPNDKLQSTDIESFEI